MVACDRRAPAAGVLGRNTFHDADMWSCAAAIENMWLTARALGLGMGWVTLMQPDELAGLLNLPEGVTTLGWLCLGWPNERPPYPGLERRAWSHKLPLDQVVMTDRWPDNGPEPPVSALAGMAPAEPVESLITRPIPDDPSSVLWSDVHAPSPQQVDVYKRQGPATNRPGVGEQSPTPGRLPFPVAPGPVAGVMRRPRSGRVCGRGVGPVAIASTGIRRLTSRAGRGY